MKNEKSSTYHTNHKYLKNPCRYMKYESQVSEESVQKREIRGDKIKLKSKMKNNIPVTGRACLFLLFPFLFFILTSCEVEFSPNADWKEVPVVYCLLDQDEDTTWVRVEKCYLSEGNIYSPGAISDSINYPAGSLDIKLYAIKDNRIVDSIAFECTLRDRDSGSFAYQQQPVYWANTRRQLREDCFYRLVVRRAATGDTLAWGETPLIVASTTPVVSSLNGMSNKFGFFFGKACSIEWRVLDNARLYQPYVRFYYIAFDTLENGSVVHDTLFVDAQCALVYARNQASTYSTSYSRDAFLNTLSEALKDDPRKKDYTKTADIYVTACSEDLNAYLSSIRSVNDLSQGREVYTNIHGGLGIFASRRTHIYRRYPCDDSDNSNSAHPGLHYLLQQLGVGFI